MPADENDDADRKVAKREVTSGLKGPRWLATKSLWAATVLPFGWLLVAFTAVAPGMPLSAARVGVLVISLILVAAYTPTTIYLWRHRD